MRAAGPLACGVGRSCTLLVRQEPRRTRGLRGGDSALVWDMMSLNVLWGRCVKVSIWRSD